MFVIRATEKREEATSCRAQITLVPHFLLASKNLSLKMKVRECSAGSSLAEPERRRGRRRRCPGGWAAEGVDGVGGD